MVMPVSSEPSETTTNMYSPTRSAEGLENASGPSSSKMRTSTIATASLSTLSPATSVYMSGSTLKAPMIESVATGSVAEMRAPKRNASFGLEKSSASAVPDRNHPAAPAACAAQPMSSMVRIVPTTAKIRMVARLWKKWWRDSEKPASKMMGGSRK